MLAELGAYGITFHDDDLIRRAVRAPSGNGSGMSPRHEPELVIAITRESPLRLDRSAIEAYAANRPPQEGSMTTHDQFSAQLDADSEASLGPRTHASGVDPAVLRSAPGIWRMVAITDSRALVLLN